MNVIFDMDGLMFDTEKVFIKAWDYAGERIGIMTNGSGEKEKIIEMLDKLVG